MIVPFVDLAPVHQPLKVDILGGIAELLDAGAFINGPHVRTFEEAFANYCGSRECVGLASGTDAIRLSLLAAGIEPGDEVIVPADTFVATVEAVAQAGGRPVLVDVSDADYNLDLEAAEAAVTARTRFLLPVHLYGQMADMRGLAAVATSRGLVIVEDACQAHGARRAGIRAGTAGLTGAFSFYPGKNLGAMGDAGALISDDPGVAQRARALREHGQVRRHQHAVEGYTARLDTIQALVLLHKLPALERWNAQRRAIARFYETTLAGVGDVVTPTVPERSEPVWHLYVIQTANATGLARFLAERGVATGRHYPTPPHLSAAYRHLGHARGAFPVTERLARDGLSLPVFPGMTEAQATMVANAIADWFHGGVQRRAAAR